MKLLTFSPCDSVPGFDASLLSAQKADRHLCTDTGEARCSLWWSVVPCLAHEKLGVIGHFETTSHEAGVWLLQRAIDCLRQQGCTLAVGPMDGNTWRRYRLCTERGSEPPFFMEPDNPDFWPDVFESASFKPLATYSSSLVCDLSRRDPRASQALERLQRDGIRIRHLDPACFEEDLRGIYAVSAISFADNYLYTEIPEETFLAQYLPYREKIRPELIQLAEYEGRTVGYLFAIPDYAEALRGEPIKTVIGKTLAVLPGRRFGGLGIVLTGLLHEQAQSLGYTRVIHALQHEGNRVRNMSEFFGQKMRRYTLYSTRLS
jgi:GNAT superfamily N-acetyltransferase